jgi:hypothetical protein
MPVQQHPLPQDISSYRFRLIGDMTIKQFASIAIGGLVAVIIYNSPLPFFFKYPIAFVFLMTGIGAAFVPFQGRPLEQWIVAFIKSIYSPTIYTWKQNLHDLPSPITATTSAPSPTQATAGTNSNPEAIGKASTPPTEIPTPPPLTQAVTNQANPASPEPNRRDTPITPPSTQPATDVKTNSEVIGENPIPPQEPTTNQPTPTTTPSLTTDPAVLTNPSPVVDTTTTPPPTPPTQPVSNESPITNQTATQVANPTISSAPTTTLPIPLTPTQPNILVGMTLDPTGLILDNVLIEIKDANQLTVRATKSNRLGQFLFSRPLEDGLYTIIADRSEHVFDTYSITLDGNIVKPLKIQSKSSTPVTNT